jgi:hypothetical protein
MTAYTLVVMSNPVEGREDEYNEWYTGRHLADVLNIPGFTGAQRFKIEEGFEGSHAYMALYEMETSDPVQVLAELPRRAGTAALPISEALGADTAMTLFTAITPRIAAKS